MLTVFALLRSTPGKEQELEDLLRELVRKVDAEEGAVAYVLHRGVSDPSSFFFYETYKDQASLDFHNATPYFHEILSVVAKLLREPPLVEIYREVASISPRPAFIAASR
jgi:quinol monooxygenase YgiN